MESFAEAAVAHFSSPPRLWSREEVLTRPCPVPQTAGVYGWYLQQLPEIVPLSGCLRVEGFALAYLGISPKSPPRNGKPPSSQTLKTRIQNHYRSSAEGSTLRLTLGCLLCETLGIQLRRVGSGGRYTFGPGEARISGWMQDNAQVCWLENAEPWKVEEALIQELDLPLNLDQNAGHPFAPALSALRRSSRAVAKELPVMTEW